MTNTQLTLAEKRLETVISKMISWHTQFHALDTGNYMPRAIKDVENILTDIHRDGRS